MTLIPDLREFIERLNSANVRFLVIGGWAFNRYGEPRYTGDLDLFFSADKLTERELRDVLEDFGFGHALPPVDRSLFERPVIMLGRPPNRLDLLTKIDGVDFDEAWSERAAGDLDGIPVHFISARHLIVNKKAAGRPKDLADLVILERRKGELPE